MKDKLTFKRKRVKWSKVVVNLGLALDFNNWYRSKIRKVKSTDKLCYLFLLNTYGRSFIKDVRSKPDLFQDNNKVLNAAKTEWIKYPEED